MVRLFVVLFALLAVALSCRNPLEGFELKFKKAYPPVLAIELADRTSNLPTAITTQLAGPDADAFVTTIYSKRFRLTDDGYLYLALDSTTKPTPTEPRWVTIVAKSAGYYDAIRPVRLINSDLQSILLVMTKVSDDALAQVLISTDNSGLLTGDQSLTATISGVKPVSVSAQKGMQGSDVKNQSVPGPLTLRIEPLPTDTRPIALSVLELSDSDGEITLVNAPVPKQLLTGIAAAAKIDLFNPEYRLIKTLTKPIQLTVGIKDGIYHPTERRVVRVGDQIPVVSYDVATDEWQQEAPATVIATSATELACQLITSHLSTFVVSFRKYACPASVNFKVKTAVPASNRLYRCEVIDDTKGNVLRTFASLIEDGKIIQVPGLVNDSFIRLKIYDNQSGETSTSTLVTGCGSSQIQPLILDLSNFKNATTVTPPITTTVTPPITTTVTPPVTTTVTPPVTTTVTPPVSKPTSVTIVLQFPCETIDAEKLPGKELYGRYRLTGTSKWKLLPVLKYVPGKTAFTVQVPVADLVPGNTYDFEAGVAIGYYTFSQPAYVLTDYSWVIRIKTDEYCIK